MKHFIKTANNRIGKKRRMIVRQRVGGSATARLGK
ncbi:MAG: hypothetical protein Hyperionvirus5_18 [Hyperionvirus sp.]|uniref:Uncharacterized protein n=1 Tax=Hyperionvirus sp. TaxID=2487770 RepID=A0A3G5A831_9VIRU|nr:MAG: hypothetical protein Hyperionvirus5_18 [Hyperionvirus sp.]